MADREEIEFEPRRVQVRTIRGDWREAFMIAWVRDPLRGWLARVVELRPASEVRKPVDGAGALRPDIHNGARRKGFHRPQRRL